MKASLGNRLIASAVSQHDNVHSNNTEEGMKIAWRRLTAVGTMILAVVGAPGCAVFMVGAGAGIGAGTVSYLGNEWRVSREVSIDRAWEAANEAMKEMEYTIIPAQTRKDKTSGIVQGRNASDQMVRIKLVRRADRLTDIYVRVGTFETPANKTAGQLLYEKMNKHL